MEVCRCSSTSTCIAVLCWRAEIRDAVQRQRLKDDELEQAAAAAAAQAAAKRQAAVAAAADEEADQLDEQPPQQQQPQQQPGQFVRPPSLSKPAAGGSSVECMQCETVVTLA